MERTLSIIKPDATRRNITGQINAIIEANNLKIVAQKKIKLTREKAEKFYEVHNEKTFFADLIDYMISDSIVVQVLESDNAISKYREIMGSTNPDNAADGTIRKMHALSVQENAVHGSDSLENANKEIDFFFESQEIVG